MVTNEALNHEIARLNAIQVHDPETIDKALAKAELLNDIGAIEFDEYAGIRDRLESLREAPTKGYNVPMAADILGISDRTVRQWIHDGKINARKIAGTRRWLIDKAEIDRLRGETM